MSTSIPALLSRIRPSVRNERPYDAGLPAPEGVVKLNQNESPFALPRAIEEAIRERVDLRRANRYPEPQPRALIAALSRQQSWPEAGILVGHGSNELGHLLALCLLHERGKVVVPRPMFSLYEQVFRLHEADILTVQPQSDYRFDIDAMVVAIRTHQPQLTVVTTPNNPTGLVVSPADLRRLAEASSGYLLVDEAYVEFNPHGGANALLAAHPNVLLLRTFSKGYGLAALRLGYLMGHPEVIQVIYRARLPFVIDVLAEETALALLENPILISDRVAQLKAGTRMLQEALRAMPGVEILPSEANFVVFRTALESEALVAGLLRHGVLTRSVAGYPELPRFVRVNAGTDEENRQFLRALDTLIQELP